MKINLKPKTSIKKKKSIFSIFFISFVIGIYLGHKDILSAITSHYYLLRAPQTVNSLFEKNDLDTLKLNISFENLETVRKNRDLALKNGRLKRSSNDFVNANIEHDGGKKNCKVRIKGDLADHWQHSKWSLRVKLKNGQTLLGMSEFSLQSPVVRENTLEWLYLKTVESQGLMGVNYRFVNLILNGEKMGIYAMEEHFSKHLIERCQRRAGVIIGFEDSRLMEVFWGDTRNQNINELYSKLPIKFYNNSSNEKLITEYNTASRLLEKLQFEEITAKKVFNSEQLGQFLALCHLWGAQHNLIVNNIKFYFNPITAQLEPIAFDACPNLEDFSPYQYFSNDFPEHSFWIKRALKDPAISYNYIKYLDLYSRPSFVNKLKDYFGNEELKYRKLLLKDLLFRDADEIFSNFSSLLYRDPWPILYERCARVRREFSLPNPILVRRIYDLYEGSIIVCNTALQPIEILGFELNGEFQNAASNYKVSDKENFLTITDNASIVVPPKFDLSEHHKVKFNFDKKINIKDLLVKVRLWGLKTEPLLIPVQQPKDIDFELLPQFSQEVSNLSDFNFIKKEKKQHFIVSCGKYKVNSDLVVPPNATLVIKAGTTLEFSKSSCLICYGSIEASANSLDPVILTDQGKGWGGIFIHNPKRQSSFKFCLFENVNGAGYVSNPNGIYRAGWNLTGALSSYDSNITIENCIFTKMYTEDALNIFGGNFKLSDCNFSNTYSDAFDGDFVSGSVQRCSFSNIGGDAVDFSGSNAHITKCSFSEITDKAISVGEKSNVIADSIFVQKTAFGVVSKDQSVVELSASTICNASIAAVSAYQKKSEFGPAKFSVNKTIFVDCSKKYLIQQKSFGEQEKVALPTEDFSSGSLYQK